jgi:MATE family multidrug resistance protein
LPTTVQHGLAMVAWTVFLSLIGLIGTVEQAASNVVVTIMSLSFLPGVSFGIAASTLISQRLGEQEPEEAELMGWEAAKLAALFMGSMGVVFLLFPELLLRIFTPEIEVIQTGVVPLRIMGAVQVFDGVGMTMGSALQGAGMNRWVMVVEVSISWFIFIPLAYLGGIVAGWGMFGAWSAVGVYLVMYAVACSWKFAGKSWQKVRI